MFDRSEIEDDMGQVVIRGFHQSEMVVTTIRYDDVQDALCNRSTRITNLRGFIDENIDFFLRDLWQKYNDGLTQFRVQGGTAYTLVEINESDIIRIFDLLQLP